MDIQIQQSDLVKTLALAASITKGATGNPIFANVLLKSQKKHITLQSCDMLSGIEITLTGEADGDGECLFSPSNVLEYISALESQLVKLSIKEGKLKISQAKSEATFPLADVKDYPQIESLGEGGNISIKTEIFLQAIKWAAISVSTEDSRPVLTGILLKKRTDKQIDIVGSDGYRLSLSSMEIEGEWKKDLLIPLRPLQQLLKDVEGERINLWYDEKGGRVWISSSQRRFFIRLIQGDFPNFTKILPTSAATSISVAKNDLQQVVRQVSIFARQNANIIKWEGRGKSIILSTQEGYGGVGKGEIGAAIEGDEIQTAFNYRYLQEYLKAVEDQDLIIQCNGSLAPVQFMAKKADGKIHIIMPVNLSSSSA